jgi:hypothetical protein
MGARFCSMSPASLGRRSFARPVLSRRSRRGSDGVALLTHPSGATSPHPYGPHTRIAPRVRVDRARHQLE